MAGSQAVCVPVVRLAILQTGVQSAGAVNKLATEIEQPVLMEKFALINTGFPFETRFVKVTV